jgi:hypothetical protein
MLSVLADGRKLTLFITLKGIIWKLNFLTIMFKCNEKEWIKEELIIEQLRSLGQKTRSPSKEREEYWVLILSRLT